MDPGEAYIPVMVGNRFRIAVTDHVPLVKEQRLTAKGTNSFDIMRHEDDRSALFLERPDRAHALLAEVGVADGERFVDDETGGFGVVGDGECEAHDHSGGICLDRFVDEFAKFREVDDPFFLALDFFPAHAEKKAVHIDVLSARHFRVEARPELQEPSDFSRNGYCAAVGQQDAGQNFKQRRFPGAVRPDDSESFAVRDTEADVLERLVRRMEGTPEDDFFQSVGRFGVELETL